LEQLGRQNRGEIHIPVRFASQPASQLARQRGGARNPWRPKMSLEGNN
jgi:hypothetical protein